MIDDQTLLTLLLVCGAALLAAVIVLLMMRGLAARTIEQRVSAVSRAQSSVDESETEAEPTNAVRRLLHWIGEAVRGRTQFYSEADITALEGMIASAGFRPKTLLPILLGMKVVMAVAVPALALFYGAVADLSLQQTVLVTCCSIPIGLFGPDWIITLARGPYLDALRRGVPDALDLLVVCSEAGMGLESALEHVGSEMRHSNAPMALALTNLLDDMRVLPDRRDAFRNFAERTGVQGARRVATMLSQSIKYGTPLSQALRSVALDLRRERMISLEAKAAKLPVKLTMPLILFIMPSLFIVLVGPAFLHMGDVMRSVGH